MAYVKLGALGPLLSSFEGLLSRKGSMRMVFGLSSRLGITDKAAAEKLLELGRRERVSIHKNNNPGFHPKLFIFRGEQPAIAIGSANLTKGAQTSNAEANVLLEDVEPAVLGDVTSFFTDCFKGSPRLRRRHIKRYREKVIGHGGGRGGSGEGLDPLPRFDKQIGELSAIRPGEVWKISPGKDAFYWEEWYNEIDDLGNGFIAIGWDVGPLDEFRSRKSLMAAVETYRTRRHESFYVGPTTDQLWAFRNLPQKEGSLVIVYSECRVFGIAQVSKESTYEYNGNSSVSYEHQIGVKYLWFDEWPHQASKYVKEQLGQQGTMFQVKNPRIWDEVVRSIPPKWAVGGRLLQALASTEGVGQPRATAYGYVFPHTQDYLPDGPVKALKDASKHPQGYWHHGEPAGPRSGGFKFLIGFEGKVHGEFEVEERLHSKDSRWKWQYVPKSGTFYRYDPPMPYKPLVGQVWRREGFTRTGYTRFARRTKLVKVP
jgi:PLD-like domain